MANSTERGVERVARLLLQARARVAAWSEELHPRDDKGRFTETLYRGEYSGNKGGGFFTPDREFARQFTQSGQEHEIRTIKLDKKLIYEPAEPVYAGDPDAMDKVIAEARAKGFKAVRLDEGEGQPKSVYVFNKTALRGAAAKSYPVHAVADLAVPAFRRAVLASLPAAGAIVDADSALAAAEVGAARLREALIPLLVRIVNASGQVAARNFKASRTAAGWDESAHPRDKDGKWTIGDAVDSLPEHPTYRVKGHPEVSVRANPLNVVGAPSKDPAWTDARAGVVKAVGNVRKAVDEGEVEMVKVKDLSTYQTFVSSERMLQLQESHERTQRLMMPGESKLKYPVGVVFDHGGKTWLVDGNHRVALAKLRGEKSVAVIRIKSTLRSAERAMDDAVSEYELSEELELEEVRSAQFNPDQARDEKGQWASGGAEFVPKGEVPFDEDLANRLVLDGKADLVSLAPADTARLVRTQKGIFPPNALKLQDTADQWLQAKPVGIFTRPPMVVRAGGRDYLMDGHHRVAVAVELGRDILVERVTVPEVRGAEVESRTLLRPSGGMKFDIANPAAVRWARTRAAKLVVDITEETRRAIRALIADGIEKGRTIRQTAKLLRAILGLTERQAASIVALYESLDEQGLTEAEIDDEINARTTELINRRADIIAHHESMTASSHGVEALWEQAVEDGQLSGLELREWIVTPDDRLCPLCAPMEGKTAAIGGAWITGDGRELGTPQEMHVSCRCTEGLTVPSVRGAAGWDESLHPRDDVGKFTDVAGGGAGAGSAEAYEAELRRQSDAGVAACEAVLDQAVRDANYSATSGPQDWESVSADDKQATQENWYEDEEERLQDNFDTSIIEDNMRSELKDELLSDDAFINSLDAPFLESVSATMDLDPASLEVDVSNDLMTSALRMKDGSELTPTQRQEAATAYNAVKVDLLDTELDERMDTDRMRDQAMEQASEVISEQANENWMQMDDVDKFSYGIDNGIIHDTEVTPGLPTTWKSGAGEEEDKTAQNDEDYVRTGAIAREMAAIRAGEIMAERGLPGATTQDARVMADHAWSSWKDSSTNDTGLALQLAAARELGGVHRLKPEEVERANAAAGAHFWADRLHPRGPDGRFIDVTGGEPFDSFSSLSESVLEANQEKVGMVALQSYVRGQWEASQFVLAKEGKERLEVYRGMILDNALVDAAKQDPSGDPFKPTPDDTIRLSDIKILRSGAQSTSSVRSVANSWRGAGGVHLSPGKNARVVLRISAPRTAVLSLPVFGVNVTEEREVVLAGTKGAWHWDAWLGRAPRFKDLPIVVPTLRGGAQAWLSGRTLVIDLIEVDRASGQNWLRGENRAGIERVRDRRRRERRDRAQLRARPSGGDPRDAAFNPSQPRDPDGKWADTGGSKFAKAKIGRMKVANGENLKKAWGKTFGDLSTDEVADRMLVDVPGAKRDWTVEIMADNDGAITIRARNDAMTVTREFSADGATVHHEILDVKYGHQGKGAAGEIIERQFEFYRDQGVKEVELVANLNVGGYAWARAGFVPIMPDVVAKQVTERVNKLRRTKAISPDEATALTGMANDIRKDPTAIWRIADLRDVRTSDEDTMPIGKHLLLGLSWFGRASVKDALDPSTPQGARFAAYFAKRRKGLAHE